MTASYRLDEEPWLPVRWPDSGPADDGEHQPERVGLRELFLSSHSIADVELPLPPASAGLWRILGLLTARVTGLDEADNPREWAERRLEVLRAGKFDVGEVESYFDGYTERFDLFGASGRPWLQDPRLVEQCKSTSGINKLCWGRSAGNNQVWLGGHATDLAPEPITPDIAVQHLIATVYYGPSGRCTPRVVDGVNKADTSAGPLRSSLSFHPLGENLFTSLVLNIPYPGDGEPDDAPWERDELDDPTGLPSEATGLAGILTNQYRHAVLLHPSADGRSVTDATITWGFRITKEFRAAWSPPTDPFQIYLTSKEGRRFGKPADAARAVWRDLDALLRDDERSGRSRPTLFGTWTSYQGVSKELQRTLKVRAFGFDQDGQTRDRQWFAAVTPAVLQWLKNSAADSEEADRARRRIRLSVSSAEGAGRGLESALKAAWKESNSPGGGDFRKTDTGTGPWLRPGMSLYWSEAGRIFWRTAFDSAVESPGNDFVLAAARAFEKVTDAYASRPRTASVIEHHRGQLFRQWTQQREDAGS